MDFVSCPLCDLCSVTILLNFLEVVAIENKCKPFGLLKSGIIKKSYIEQKLSFCLTTWLKFVICDFPILVLLLTNLKQTVFEMSDNTLYFAIDAITHIQRDYFDLHLDLIFRAFYCVPGV